MRTARSHSFCYMISTIFCSLLPALTAPAAAIDRDTNVQIPWDWSGIIGTGQSLAVGEQGQPVLSQTQPYHNLKLSTDHQPWPIDPNDTNLIMVPLVEP